VRILPRLILYGGVTLVGLAIAGGVAMEGALHIQPSFRARPDDRLAQELSHDAHSSWSAVQTRAFDGTILRAWIFRPEQPGRGAVLLLHGVGDSRTGMLGHARYLLAAGYTVLLPDSRGHGISGGDLISYGLSESKDVRTWTQWLSQHEHPAALFGLGESMGAAVLLQSLAHRPGFRAIVAECTFSDFTHIAEDRAGQILRVEPTWMLLPLVDSGFLYARLRYGLALSEASPIEALRGSDTPVLLIHGAEDHNISPEHSRMVAAARPLHTRLWEVPGAEHVGASVTDPAGFTRAVLGWFAENQAPQ
jgi:uncharacterized protein